MDLHLSGKVAVVTGASRGIGSAITQALVDEGACVVAGARAFDDSASAAVHRVGVDLSTPQGADELIEDAISTFGRLDILVNNVGGVRPRLGGFGSVTDDDWTWALDINFLAAVRVTRAALPHLLVQTSGAIVR